MGRPWSPFSYVGPRTLTGARATPRVPGRFRLAEGWGGLALAPLHVLRHQTVIRGAHRATQGPWNVAGKAPTLTLGWGPHGIFQAGSGLFTSLGSVPLGGGVGVLSFPFTHRSQALPRHQGPGSTLPRWSPMVPAPHVLPSGVRSGPSPPYPLQTPPVDLGFLSFAVGGVPGEQREVPESSGSWNLAVPRAPARSRLRSHQ